MNKVNSVTLPNLLKIASSSDPALTLGQEVQGRWRAIKEASFLDKYQEEIEVASGKITAVKLMSDYCTLDL